jgi:hypothetical protein
MKKIGKALCHHYNKNNANQPSIVNVSERLFDIPILFLYLPAFYLLYVISKVDIITSFPSVRIYTEVGLQNCKFLLLLA